MKYSGRFEPPPVTIRLSGASTESSSVAYLSAEVLKKEAGTQFQPELVECFVKCRKEIELAEKKMELGER